MGAAGREPATQGLGVPAGQHCDRIHAVGTSAHCRQSYLSRPTLAIHRSRGEHPTSLPPVAGGQAGACRPPHMVHPGAHGESTEVGQSRNGPADRTARRPRCPVWLQCRSCEHRRGRPTFIPLVERQSLDQSTPLRVDRSATDARIGYARCDRTRPGAMRASCPARCRIDRWPDAHRYSVRPNQRARRRAPKRCFSARRSADGAWNAPVGSGPERKSTSTRAIRFAPNSM
jgi:hypothetical protein